MIMADEESKARCKQEKQLLDEQRETAAMCLQDAASWREELRRRRHEREVKREYQERKAAHRYLISKDRQKSAQAASAGQERDQVLAVAATIQQGHWEEGRATEAESCANEAVESARR